MQIETTQDRLDRDGFVVIPGCLPARSLIAAPENLDRYVRDVVPTLPDADAFYEDRSRPETLKQLQRMGADPFFEAYRQSPALGARWRRSCWARRPLPNSRNGSTSRLAPGTSRRRIRTTITSA